MFYVAASAQNAQACTTDRLELDGKSLGITLCDDGSSQAADGVRLQRLREIVTYGSKSFAHADTQSVPDGSAAARVIDDLDLAPLGIAERLHITVRFAAGGPILEHALALPGPEILR